MRDAMSEEELETYNSLLKAVAKSAGALDYYAVISLPNANAALDALERFLQIMTIYRQEQPSISADQISIGETDKYRSWTETPPNFYRAPAL